MTGKPLSDLIEEYEQQAKDLERIIEKEKKNIGFQTFDESKTGATLKDMLLEVRIAIRNMKEKL